MITFRFSQITLVVFLLTLTKPAFSEAMNSCMKKQRTCRYNPGSEKYVRVKNYVCDTQTDGGGWIIFQRRVRQDTRFFRNWTEYENGFGDPRLCEDYWLGNRKLHALTSKKKRELRIDMTYKDKNYFVKYDTFKVDSEENNYRLTVGRFTGNLSIDELASHNGMMFSTHDRDNDNSPNNCALVFQAGWWYNNCHHSNLNGQFNNAQFGLGVNWYNLTTFYSSLSSVEMKMK